MPQPKSCWCHLEQLARLHPAHSLLQSERARHLHRPAHSDRHATLRHFLRSLQHGTQSVQPEQERSRTHLQHDMVLLAFVSKVGQLFRFRWVDVQHVTCCRLADDLQQGHAANTYTNSSHSSVAEAFPICPVHVES
jgi:hypothetical protein